MGLYKNYTRNRSVPGSLSQGALGVVERSIGYLQGGYKDSTINSAVQMFSTITQVGQIVYDTGYQRYYRPGISGNTTGYFSISDTVAYNKFSFISGSASSSFSTALNPSVSVSDLGYTVAWLLVTATPSLVASIDDWLKLNLTTETPTSQGNLSANPYGTTRQAMGTSSSGFFCNPNNTSVTALNFNTNAVATQTVTPIDTGIQIPCGMSVNDTHGYFVGFVNYNIRLNVSGTTIQSYNAATSYTYNFGESHSLTSATHGYMMAGYIDTTGRYGNTQHGLCQSIALATESITTLPDLVLAQSSGQMMEGF